jgi:hypothetical protein
VLASVAVVLYACTPAPPQVVNFVLLAAVVVGIFLHLFGQLLCLWVPPEAEARGVLLLSIALSVVGKAVVLAEFFNGFLTFWAFPGEVLLLSQLGELFSVLSSLAFLIFLKRLSRYLAYGDGEVDAEGLLFLWGLSIFLYLLNFGLALAASVLLPGNSLLGALFALDVLATLFLMLLAVFGLVLLVVGVMTFIKYCNLLTRLREVIVQRLEADEAERREKKPGLAPS